MFDRIGQIRTWRCPRIRIYKVSFLYKVPFQNSGSESNDGNILFWYQLQILSFCDRYTDNDLDLDNLSKLRACRIRNFALWLANETKYTLIDWWVLFWHYTVDKESPTVEFPYNELPRGQRKSSFYRNPFLSLSFLPAQIENFSLRHDFGLQVNTTRSEASVSSNLT